MSEHADSEIRRLPLDSLVLDLKSMMPDSPVVPVLEVGGDATSGRAAQCGVVLVGGDEGGRRMVVYYIQYVQQSYIYFHIPPCPDI